MSLLYTCKSIKEMPPFMISINSATQARRMFGAHIELSPNKYEQDADAQADVIIDVSPRGTYNFYALRYFEKCKRMPHAKLIIVCEQDRTGAMVAYKAAGGGHWISKEIEISGAVPVPGFEHLTLHYEDLKPLRG